MNRPSDFPPAIRAVFDTFTAETRIPLRLVSQIQMQQATAFAEHFERWELVLVFRWIHSRIALQDSGRERTGYSRQSLQWHCIFGNDGDLSLARFQQKLGLAMEWAKRNAPSLIPAELRGGQAPATPTAATIHKASEGAVKVTPEEAKARLAEALKGAGL